MFDKKIAASADGYLYCACTTESANFSAHLHKYYEFLHIIEGNLYCIVENTEYLLSPGDMIITAPEELHSISFSEKCTYTREFLQVKEELIDSHFPHAADALKNKPLGKFNYISSALFDSYRLGDIFREIYTYARDERAESEMMITACAMQLIVKVGEILSKEDIKIDVKQGKNTKKIRSYILNHLYEKINLDILSEYCYLDKSYLCRMFKQEMGMTINTYINMQRTAAAKNMILSGTKITDAYSRCGFNDYSTFYRTFLKYAGMTPEEFKKQYAPQIGHNYS